jgi:hypothetical protein
MLALGLLFSCSKDDRVGDPGLFGEGTGEGDGGTGGGGDDGNGGTGGDGTGDDGDGGDDGTDGPKFDVAAGTGDGGDVDEDGCDKVDFLFVVGGRAGLPHHGGVDRQQREHGVEHHLLERRVHMHAGAGVLRERVLRHGRQHVQRLRLQQPADRAL